MSLVLGCFSIGLLITLRHSGYPSAILFVFLVVGLALIFSGDYLLNLFRLPVTQRKQELASDIGLIAYGLLYFGIAMSKPLTTPLVNLPFTRLFATDLGATRISRCRYCLDRCGYLRHL